MLNVADEALKCTPAMTSRLLLMNTLRYKLKRTIRDVHPTTYFQVTGFLEQSRVHMHYLLFSLIVFSKLRG